MMKNLIKFILFISLAIVQTPLFEKEILAQQYYDSGFFDDAIMLYEEILTDQIEIVGDNNLYLENTLIKLSELYYLVNDLESSKYYIQKIININTKNIINAQNKFSEPLNILKEILIKEKKYDKVYNVDSLITILDTNNDTLPNDSIFVLPKIIINNKISTENETSYSNNDSAIDVMNEGLLFLENELYSQAAENMLKSFSFKASNMDLNYFENLNLANNINDSLFYNAFKDISQDSLKSNAYFFLGMMDYQNNHYDLATENFKIYSKKNPSDIRALQAIGNIYFQNEDWIDAIYYYFKILQIEENNLIAKLNISKSLIAIDEYKDAEDILKSIINIYPNNFEIYYNLGLCYFNLNEFEFATKKFSQAILLNTTNSEIYYYLGLSYNALESYKQALDAFIKCTKLNPYNGSAHFEIGNIYKLIFENDLAITHYKKAKKYINTDDLNLSLGMLLFANKEYQKSIKPLKEYILQNMYDWEILYMYSQSLINTNRNPEAIDIYIKLIDEFPDQYEYYFDIAECYYKINDFSNALENYKKALEFNEENFTVLYKIGSLHNQLNEFYEAEKYLNQALYCGSPNKELLVQIGMSYGGQKKFLQSLEAFKGALKLSLNDPIIHYQLGIIYKELEIYNLAIDEFNQYLINNSNDYIAYYLIGESYFNLERYNIALEYFTKSFNINKSHIKSLYQIGSCHLKLDDNKKAAKIFKSIVKNDPNHVESRFELINVYLALNKSREAKKECEIIYMLDREIYNSIDYCNAKN